MLINFDKKEKTPLYQHLVDYFIRNIKVGVLPPNYKLPTVRVLSKENRIAQGTVKHAYDILEQLGYIKMSQGRGSFVCDINKDAVANASKKDQAMEAIDKLIDRMKELSFSIPEIRIFLDLKLRERENLINYISVGAIDCAPEALSAMAGQLSTIKNIDIYPYLLQDVLASPEPISPNLDILITTPTHHNALKEKLGDSRKLIQLVMSVAGNTLLSMARIPAQSTVGILCASERFAEIISKNLTHFNIEQKPSQIALFGDESSVLSVMDSVDYILLPDNYLQYASAQEREAILRRDNQENIVLFRYQIEKGSLLYLEEQLSTIRKNQSEQY